jgi:hypothetical protein
MATMHTAMKPMFKANNSVRHLPLAQLEGAANSRSVAHLSRSSCAAVAQRSDGIIGVEMESQTWT